MSGDVLFQEVLFIFTDHTLFNMKKIYTTWLFMLVYFAALSTGSIP